MNPLPIPLNLTIKNRIFIPRPHLPQLRHLRLPPLDRLDRGREPLLGERVVDRGDDGVDGGETFALAGLLGAGETPGDFPVDLKGMFLVGFWVGRRMLD